MRKIINKLTLLLLIISIFIPALAFAIPPIMSYQGKLNDKNGVPVSGSVSMIFSIYNVKEGGIALWTETWTGTNSVNVSNGIFNAALGSHQDFPADLFSSDALYLGIQVGSDAEMIPRQQIVSGSYAFKAKTVEYNVPVGTIQAWAKNLTGVPALPDGWVECNGQTLSDPDSPMNGTLIPDINGYNNGQPNGTQRFLRGSTTSGTTGGRDSFSWSHRHNYASGSSSSYKLSSTSVGYLTDYQGGTEDLKPPFYEVVWIIKVK